MTRFNALRFGLPFALLLCTFAARAQSYSAHVLPLPAGAQSGMALATTKTGTSKIVGTITDSAGAMHVATWTGGAITVLADYSPNLDMEGTGIDASGNVYGWAYVENADGSFSYQALKWPGGGAPVLLPNPTGSASSRVRAVAPNGTAVGETTTTNLSGVLWPNGLPSVLPWPSGYNICSGADTNNAGQSVGFCTDPTWTDNRAMLWISGYATILPKLSGGDSASANAINASGVVAGAGTDSSGEDVALVWTNAVSTKLPRLAKATYAAGYAINASGLVGGQSDGGSVKTVRHATIWAPPYSAATELPTPSGTTACDLTGLNDAGNGVGYCLSTASGNWVPVSWTTP